MKKLQGTFTALVTPLRDDAIDFRAFDALVQAQLEAGIDGLVPCGTTGEAVTLSASEWERVVARTVELCAGRVPVIAGVGSNDTRATSSAAQRAQALGADAVLVVTPYYNRPSQEGLYRHFKAVTESISIGVVLYNVPGRTGVHLEPATVARLMELPRVVAIKEATGNLMVASELRQLCGERLSLLSGDDFTALALIAQGGEGVISVASNLVPEKMVALVKAARGGELARAQALHRQLYPLFQALFVESNPIPIKTAMAMLGWMSDERRLPLCEPNPATTTRLRAALEGLELLSRAS